MPTEMPLREVLKYVEHTLTILPKTREEEVTHELREMFYRLRILWTPLKYKGVREPSR